MALYPKAVLKLIPPGSNDPRITVTQLILHVAVSLADSLHDYFDGPSGGIESHFYIRFDGTVEQYRDTAFEADANYKANPRAISVETEGMGDGVWTLEQLAAIKELILWAKREHPELQLATVPAWDAAGVGYHSQFPEWSPVAKSCPGPNRIKQFYETLVPWMKRMSQPRLLKVVTHNLWKDNPYPNKAINKALAESPHVAGFNEAKKYGGLLEAVAGYQAFGVGENNTVLVKDGIKVLDSGVEPMCDAVGISPARSATWVAFKFAGKKWAWVESHWNSHVEVGGKPRTLPRVAQYVAHMKNMVRLVRRLRRAGYQVIVSGDTNWSWAPVSWESAPINVFALLRMRATFANRRTAPAGGTMDKGNRKIDCIFFRPGQLHVFSQRLIHTSSDHHALEVVFRVVE